MNIDYLRKTSDALHRYSYTGTATPAILITHNQGDHTVTLSNLSSDTSVQVTLSSLEDIKNDLAHWVLWSPGVVNQSIIVKVDSPVTAIRATGSSFTIDICT